MAGSNLIEVKSSGEWAQHLSESARSGKTVVVDFKAVWCGPCRMMAPIFEELSRQYPQVLFLKVDVDELKDVARECEIKAMPTFIIFVKGRKVEEIVGANANQLKAAVEKFKGQASFSGTGRTLGEVPGGPGGSATSVTGQYAGADPSKPMTSVRFRLPNGASETGQFNTSDTVGDLRRYLQTQFKVSPQCKLLDSSFPPKPLVENEATLEAAGLLNSQITVRQ